MKELKSLVKSFKLLIFTIKQKRKLKADKPTIEYRLSQCKNCNNLNKKRLLFINKDRCGLCGCFIKYKTKLSYESCPDETNQRW